MKGFRKKFLVSLMVMICAIGLSVSAQAAVTVVGTAGTNKQMTITAGQKAQLIVPGLGKIKWKSTNRKVATVSSKGSLTAKKAGTASIVARAKKGGAQAVFTVHVRPNQWMGDMKTRHAYLHYPTNFLGFRVLKMYYRGKKLYVEGFWANNTPSDYNRLKTSLEIRDASHGNRLIARKTLQFKAALPAYKCQIYNMTYVFKGKELKAKNYDLASIGNLNFVNYLR